MPSCRGLISELSIAALLNIVGICFHNLLKPKAHFTAGHSPRIVPTKQRFAKNGDSTRSVARRRHLCKQPCDVVESDHHHEKYDKRDAERVEGLDSEAGGAAAHYRFYAEYEEPAAVERGYRYEIDDGEVDRNERRKHQHRAEAILRSFTDIAHDADGTDDRREVGRAANRPRKQYPQVVRHHFESIAGRGKCVLESGAPRFLLRSDKDECDAECGLRGGIRKYGIRGSERNGGWCAILNV